MTQKGIGVGHCPSHGEYNLDVDDGPCPSCEDSILEPGELLVLLGVEGCVESEGTPGVRGFEDCDPDAFDEVIKAFCLQAAIPRNNYANMLIDSIGRPYLLRAIMPGVALPAIVKRAQQRARMKRLLP